MGSCGQYMGIDELMIFWCEVAKGKGIQFIVLYPPKRLHDLPPLAGQYTRKPFQSPGGYSRATGSI